MNIMSDSLLLGALTENGQVDLHLDHLETAKCSLCLTSLTLDSGRLKQCYRGGTTLDNDTTRSDCGSAHLKCVASRGSFVIFVALQGEGGNADIKVGAISSFNTKRPPEKQY